MRRKALSVAMAVVGSIGWRTDGTGKYPDAVPPVEWSAQTNVVWKTPMPSWSNATPIIVGERIFVCSEKADLLCVRASDGEILWQRSNDYAQLVPPEQAEEVRQEVAKADGISEQINDLKRKRNGVTKKLKKTPDDQTLKDQYAQLRRQIADLAKQFEAVQTYATPRTNKDNGYSTHTPVSDGEHVYVLTGLGTVACYDMAGNRKWIKRVDSPTHNYGNSTSPVLVDGKLIVHIRDAVALDAQTGEQVWRTKSNNRDVWGTPVCTEVDGTKVLIGANGDVIRIADGKVLAKKISKLKYASPVVADGVVYFAQYGGRALKLPEKIGEEFKCEQLWQALKIKKDRYYASAVVHEGLVYAITQKNVLSVLDAKTGLPVYRREMKLGKDKDAVVYPSITLAGKHIYVSSDTGVTIVIAPGREYKEIASNKLEKFRSCPVFVGTRMYVRGYEHLYCIGK